VRDRFLNFKTGALNHSATLPTLRDQALGGAKIKNGLATGPNLEPIWSQWRANRTNPGRPF
jgi:hypothetical protein